jgi:competence protein ComEA
MQMFKSLVFTVLLILSGFSFAAQVNINTADSETISAELSGIGKSKAEAIVAYREKHGPFKNADDLARVKGIGQATVDKNRDNILIQ